MTLLDEIIEGASGDASVTTLLRKLKVVAARTSAAPLAAWVDRELDGYRDGDDVPNYRGPFQIPMLGHFVGPLNAELRNLAIPEGSFPEDMRTGFEFIASQPVAQLEAWTQQSTVRLGWPADLVEAYNGLVASRIVRRIVQEGFILVSVVRPIETSLFVRIIDAVRGRILSLALELERVAPSAGQGNSDEEAQADVRQVVNSFNFYGTSNVAVESQNVTQNVNLPNPGNREDLIRFLGAAGVPARSLVDLEDAIAVDQAEDEAAAQPGRFLRVRAWASAASTDLATTAAGGAIASGIAAFLSTR